MPLANAAEEIERTRRIPEPLLTQLHDAGLFRMLLPEELGGGEVEPGVYVTVLEELARHDASVAWNLFVGNSAALIAPYMDESAAAKVFSNSRTVVAWGPPHKGLAEAAAGGYRTATRRCLQSKRGHLRYLAPPMHRSRSTRLQPRLGGTSRRG